MIIILKFYLSFHKLRSDARKEFTNELPILFDAGDLGDLGDLGDSFLSESCELSVESNSGESVRRVFVSVFVSNKKISDLLL